MPSAQVIVASLLAILVLSCSRLEQSGSEVRSLDELAEGREGEAKACAGLFGSKTFEDRIEYDSGVDVGRIEPALSASLTAVPLPVRQLFKAVGGKIRITPEAATLCATPSAVGASASSCFKVGGKIGGAQDDVTIVVADDATVASSRVVRAFGYVVSQYFGRLYKKGSGFDLRLGLNSAFAASQAKVGAAFLVDLGLSESASRGAELASRAYAEAFDSWYCQAGGAEAMKARFPRTHDAFAEVNAYVQQELARVVKALAKSSALALQDAPASEKINGDLSQAATTEVTAATSQAANPLISGSKADAQTFVDPAPGPTEPVAGPNDVVVTINADGTFAGAGTDNIANDGQLVIIDNRDHPTNASADPPATDKPLDTKVPPVEGTTAPTADSTTTASTTDSTTVPGAMPPEVPTNGPGPTTQTTDVLTGGIQPSGADSGFTPADQGVGTAVPGQTFDSTQSSTPGPSPFGDAGGQVFAGAGC